MEPLKAPLLRISAHVSQGPCACPPNGLKLEVQQSYSIPFSPCGCSRSCEW